MGERGMLFISTISSPVPSFLVHFEITALELLVPYELAKLREKRTKKREKQELESDDLLQDQDQDLLQDLYSLQDLDLPNLQLALDLIHEVKEDLDQKLIPQIHSQEERNQKKRRILE